jgi:uncharacterized protein (DUF952 family)
VSIPDKDIFPIYMQKVLQCPSANVNRGSLWSPGRFSRVARRKGPVVLTTPIRNPDLIYKVAMADVVDRAVAIGTFTGMPIDERDGYLHFSTAAQLPETLKLHFAGQEDLILLALRSHDIGAALRWEPSRGGQLFPHVYGTFPMTAVVHEAKIGVAADGSCTLPAWVR